MGLGLPAATLAAYHLTPQQVAQDPLLALETAARSLSQEFTQYGSWEQALSAYLTGDPTAYQSPTGPIGGAVYSILGAAAINPTLGLGGAYTPASGTGFVNASDAFLSELQKMGSAGGVVSPQVEANYRQVSAGIATRSMPVTGNVPFRSSATVAQAMQDVLNAAGIPVTAANVTLLETMARGEGMPLGDFNWLATTQGQGQDVNSVGVKAFPNYQTGVTATAQTLLNGNYGQLVKLMQSGASLSQMARDPGVQANLRTWQGGSNEDVNLLLGQPDQSGTPITPAAAQPSTGAGSTPTPKAPAPSEVGSFAAQLQQAGITPQQFNQWFQTVADQRRRLLGSKSTSISDFAQVLGQATTDGGTISQASLTAAIANQPHPTYPDITVGKYQSTLGMATLHSVAAEGRVPPRARWRDWPAPGPTGTRSRTTTPTRRS